MGVVQAGQAGGERVAGRVRVRADLQVEGGLLVVVGVIALLAAIVWWFRDDVREWYHSLDRP